ncbi:hypothetical protein BC830DRAFT_1077561 [Chytriomyces sp. MP71]|nr:hypothetical protein BC830DRAFT_1077561 [Chytriomyces sp. MP71]
MNDGTVQLASNPAHLEQIHALMQTNMKHNLTSLEEGFLSIEYSLPYLHEMHQTTPAIVVLAPSSSHPNTDPVVVAYALAVDKDTARRHKELGEAIEIVDARCIFEGRALRDVRYVIMAQVCVAEGWRGKGLVQDMYALFTREYRDRGFELVETEVSKANERSMKAHLKSGWVAIDSLFMEGGDWHIIVLDLTK